MEKRIGAAIILVEDKSAIPQLNDIISRHSHIIIGRQGVPLQNKGVSVITLIFEGTTDDIGALTGQIGRLRGLQIKSASLKAIENEHYC
jgi:putative iron-only hydrogenase system regulator